MAAMPKICSIDQCSPVPVTMVNIPATVVNNGPCTQTVLLLFSLQFLSAVALSVAQVISLLVQVCLMRNSVKIVLCVDLPSAKQTDQNRH